MVIFHSNVRVTWTKAIMIIRLTAPKIQLLSSFPHFPFLLTNPLLQSPFPVNDHCSNPGLLFGSPSTVITTHRWSKKEWRWTTRASNHIVVQWRVTRVCSINPTSLWLLTRHCWLPLLFFWGSFLTSLQLLEIFRVVSKRKGTTTRILGQEGLFGSEKVVRIRGSGPTLLLFF